MPSKITLGETPGGKYILSLDLFNNMHKPPTYGDKIPVELESIYAVWKVASRRFSRLAKGNVCVWGSPCIECFV
jgi:hypothetical protein